MSSTINGKTIVRIRTLSTSKYKTKSGKKEKVVIGVTIPQELLKVAGFKVGKFVRLTAVEGVVTARFIAVKEIEKLKSKLKLKQQKPSGSGSKPAKREEEGGTRAESESGSKK